MNPMFSAVIHRKTAEVVICKIINFAFGNKFIADSVKNIRSVYCPCRIFAGKDETKASV